MSAETSTSWGRSPFASVERVDPELLRSEGRVRYLLVRGGSSGVGVVGAIWVSDDGLRGGVIPNPEGLWAAGELIRNHRNAVERGWSPLRIFSYWRENVEPLGFEIGSPQTADSLRDLKALVEQA